MGVVGALLCFFHALVLDMSTLNHLEPMYVHLQNEIPIPQSASTWACSLPSSVRLFRGCQGSDVSCGVFQGGQHSQVTNYHLGTLRRVRQEQPCHQHASSDNAHHGRPGALWKVSEASHCPAQTLTTVSSPRHLHIIVILGYVGKGRDFFFFLVVLRRKCFYQDNSHHSLCPLT